MQQSEGKGGKKLPRVVCLPPDHSTLFRALLAPRLSVSSEQGPPDLPEALQTPYVFLFLR